jgi:type IV secretory pathway component VirB8
MPLPPIPEAPLISNTLALISFSFFMLILILGIVFIISVTYLKQWDIYYPRLGRWLKSRKVEKLEKERKDKKRKKRLEK